MDAVLSLSDEISLYAMMSILKKLVDVLTLIVLIGLMIGLLYLWGCMMYFIYHTGLGLSIFWTIICGIITTVVMWRLFDLFFEDYFL